MSLYPVDTLAYQLGHRPLARRMDLSQTPMTAVAGAVTQYRSQFPGEPRPEQDAIQFYAYNHLTALVRQRVHKLEALGDYFPVVDFYNTAGNVMARRMFCYLLLICTREMRHLHNKDEMSGRVLNEGLGNLVAKHSKDEMVKVCQWNGTIPDDPTSAMNAITNKPPKFMLGAYCDTMEVMFRKGSWSSSYGGKKWADIALCLANFVNGVYSAELMLDVGFALAHNGGPIFNKGMFYKTYDASVLARVLDVQRCGQIPNMLLTSQGKAVPSHYLPAGIVGELEKWAEVFPEISTPVKWEGLKAMGALHDYTSWAKQQGLIDASAKGPASAAAMPNKLKKKIILQPKDPEGDESALGTTHGVVNFGGGGSAKVKQSFYVMPGVAAKVVERIKANV